MSRPQISRPFAFNRNPPISGTQQVGDIAIGTPDVGFEASGVQWWNGPDESIGYVIAKPVTKSVEYPGGLTDPNYPDQSTPVTVNELSLSNAYRGSDVVLSNGYQTAHQQFGYQQSVLGNTTINVTDKIMFSVLVNLAQPSTLADTHFIGIGYTWMNLQGNPYGAFPGNDTYSMGYCSDGYIYYNGGRYAGGLQTWGDGDIIDIAIDNNINGLWVRVNGGYWNNNPTANPMTGTNKIEAIGGPFYPALCPGYEGTMTIQNTSTYYVPVRFLFLGKTLAAVGFLRSADLTEASFIELVNVHFRENFSTATDAYSYLVTNNYWTSFGGFTLYGNGDITYNTQRYGGYSSTTNTGFICDGNRDTYNGIIYNLTGSLAADIATIWTAAGLDTNNAYVWNINWTTGGSIVARVALNPDNISSSIAIVPIDKSDTRWQSGIIGGPTLAGTFEFPATFTLYIPTTQISNHTDWC